MRFEPAGSLRAPPRASPTSEGWYPYDSATEQGLAWLDRTRAREVRHRIVRAGAPWSHARAHWVLEGTPASWLNEGATVGESLGNALLAIVGIPLALWAVLGVVRRRAPRSERELDAG